MTLTQIAQRMKKSRFTVAQWTQDLRLPDKTRADGRPFHATEEEINRAVELRRQGVSIAEIAERIGRSRVSVGLWCRRVLPPTDRKRASEEEINRAVELRRQGLPPKEIAERISRPVNFVYVWLRRLGMTDSAKETEKQEARHLYQSGLTIRSIANRLGRNCCTVTEWTKGLTKPVREPKPKVVKSRVVREPKPKVVKPELVFEPDPKEEEQEVSQPVEKEEPVAVRYGVADLAEVAGVSEEFVRENLDLMPKPNLGELWSAKQAKRCVAFLKNFVECPPEWVAVYRELGRKERQRIIDLANEVEGVHRPRNRWTPEDIARILDLPSDSVIRAMNVMELRRRHFA